MKYTPVRCTPMIYAPVRCCQELVPRGTRPAYFCLLVPRVQATVSHNDKED